MKISRQQKQSLHQHLVLVGTSALCFFAIILFGPHVCRNLSLAEIRLLAYDIEMIYIKIMIYITLEAKMQIAKWGNSLAVRLPAELVREMGLKEGDQIDLVQNDGPLKIQRLPRADEVLEGLRRFRGRLAATERLGRDAAHER